MTVKISTEELESFAWLATRLGIAANSALQSQGKVKNLQEAHPRIRAKHEAKVSLSRAMYHKYRLLLRCFTYGAPVTLDLAEHIELLHEYIKARVHGAKLRQLHAMSPAEIAKRQTSIELCERELAIYRTMRCAFNEHLKLWL